MNVDNLKPLIEENLSKQRYKGHVSDIRYSVHYIQLFLSILGIWPYAISNPTKIERYVSKFAMLLFTAAGLMFVTLHLCEIILEDTDSERLLELLGRLCFIIASILKFVILALRRDLVHFCIDHMKTDWMRIQNQNDRIIMMRNLKIGHDLTKLVAVFLYSTMVLYYGVKPFVTPNSINEFNQTVRLLPVTGVDIFINLRAGYNYEIALCSILISMLLMCTVAVATCNLTATFVTHACGQFKIVISRIENLVDVDSKDKDTIEDRIAFIVSFHVRVLRFSSKIDELIRDICLLEVLHSITTICYGLYFSSQEWNNNNVPEFTTYMTATLSFSFNIFIFCYIGELLKEQCFQVGKAAYMIKWYKVPGKTQLALFMITAISNYPCKITAGRMVELSIVTFTDIFKMAFAFFNMMRA